MSWYQSKEIKEVSSLFPNLLDDKLIFFDHENNLISYDVKKMSEVHKRHFEKSFILNVVGDDIFAYLDDSIHNLNPITLDLDQVWKAKFGRPAILNQENIYEQLYQRKDKTVHLGVYDRHHNTELWKSAFTGHRFARNIKGRLFITDINFTYFICLNLETGKESWTYSFPDGEKVQGNIHLHEGILVVPSMAGQMPYNKNYLRGVDVNTGKEIWKNEGYFLHLQQDPTTGLLYGFAGEKYQVIDPLTGNQLADKEFAELKGENRLQVYQGMSRLYGDGLYFTSDYVENVYDCQFGKINTESHEIEFIQKLDVEEGVKAHPPIYHKGKLYIKDTLDTLHVYEQTT